MAKYIELEKALALRRAYNLDGGYDLTEEAVPVKDLQAIPAADVRHVPGGEWIRRRDEFGPYFECPFCRKSWYRAAMASDNFCPNCGADMRGGAGDG